MRRMGLWAIYQKPRTTIPGSISELFPCLVSLEKITSIVQVWATDTTYIRMYKGSLYQVSIMDLFSRNVLSWKLSICLDTQICMDALEMALASNFMPEIFYSDQGCQSTSTYFVCRLQGEDIKIIWSGRRRCYDTILVERLWRTVMYVEFYLRAFSNGWEAEISLARFLWRHAHVRPNSSLPPPPCITPFFVLKLDYTHSDMSV